MILCPTSGYVWKAGSFMDDAMRKTHFQFNASSASEHFYAEKSGMEFRIDYLSVFILHSNCCTVMARCMHTTLARWLASYCIAASRVLLLMLLLLSGVCDRACFLFWREGIIGAR